MSRTGTQVTVQMPGGGTYKRNISHLRKYRQPHGSPQLMGAPPTRNPWKGGFWNESYLTQRSGVDPGIQTRSIPLKATVAGAQGNHHLEVETGRKKISREVGDGERRGTSREPTPETLITWGGGEDSRHGNRAACEPRPRRSIKVGLPHIHTCQVYRFWR